VLVFHDRADGSNWLALGAGQAVVSQTTFGAIEHRLEASHILSDSLSDSLTETGGESAWRDRIHRAVSRRGTSGACGLLHKTVVEAHQGSIV
jgi:hypothetical protein